MSGRKYLLYAAGVLLAAAVVILLAYQQTSAQVPVPLERPKASTLETWVAQVKARLPVYASLEEGSRPVGTGPLSGFTCQLYRATLEVWNQSGHPLETGNDFLLVEASRQGAAAKAGESPLVGGYFSKSPLEDYAGAAERLSRGFDSYEFLGLYNLQVPGDSGVILRHHRSTFTFNYDRRGEPPRADYGRAAPGESLSLSVEYELDVTLESYLLDQVVLVSPALRLRDKQREAPFRYLLAFTKRASGSERAERTAWKLAETRLIPLTAESLVPLATEAAAPLWQRVLATHWAGEDAGAAAEPVLVAIATAKGKEKERLRMTALGALRPSKDATVLEKVLAIAQDRSEDERVRFYAIQALGQLGGHGATEPLLAMVRGKDEREARQAIGVLGRLGDKAAAEPLLSVLEDSKRSDDHRATGKALARLADNRHLERLARLAKTKERKTRNAAIEAIGGIGTPEAMTLLAGLSGGEQETAWEALRALGKIDHPAAVAALQPRLADPGKEVRYAAVYGIAAVENEQRLALLREALRSEYKDVREQAAEKLGLFRLAAAPAELPGLLRDPQPDVRSAAARALGQLKDKTAIEPLAGALRDKDGSVRESAVAALGWIGTPAAIEALRAARNNPESAVRVEATNAFGRIRSPQAVEALVEALKDQDGDIRRATTVSLGKLRYARSVETLISLLGDKDKVVAAMAASGLRELTGEDLGEKAEPWQKWWTVNKGKFPTR